MKSLKFVGAFAVAITLMTATAFAAETATVVVDGKTLSSTGIVTNGRTLVPARDIAESLGATVLWDAAKQTVSIERQIVEVTPSTQQLDYTWQRIVMEIGNTSILVNGTEMSLDVPAQIIDDKTMVPVRAVSEWFYADVAWDEASHTVTITSALNQSAGDAKVQNDLSKAAEKNALNSVAKPVTIS